MNILDSDFFLADLFVDDKGTSSIDDDTPIKDELFVVFRKSRYEIAKENLKSLFNATIGIKDKTKYEQFWKKWHEDYYVWDCAAGTGNLLVGLTNKYHIWASTLDQADVNAMQDRIRNGANLLPDHVFQFDFLNDDFSKLQGLQNIINDPEKRKKLVIYINPPYAEAGDTKQRTGSGKNKENVSNLTKIHNKYSLTIKDFAKRELFVQFFARVYEEIPNCILAQFSKLKLLQAPYFSEFRNYFLADLVKMFVVPAKTFDNVKGNFPIGFFIWDLKIKKHFTEITSRVYNSEGVFEINKKYFSYENLKNINDWLRSTLKDIKYQIAFLTCNSNDFQNSISVFIQTHKKNQTSTYYKPVTEQNLIQSSIYYSVRSMTATSFYIRMKAGKKIQNFRMIVWLIHFSATIYNHSTAPTTGYLSQRRS